MAADVFISYTESDEAWAVWTAWQLTDAGYSVIVQAWDFGDGENFLAKMHEASVSSTCTLALLSPAFLQSRYAMEELWVAFHAERLLPIRVHDVKLDGLLAARVATNFARLERSAAREHLLEAVGRKLSGMPRAVPLEEPAFPGDNAPPPYPGAVAQRVRFGLPRELAYFTGRQDELDRLDEALSRDSRAVVTQAIAGLGGVGENKLASAYVRAHMNEYAVVAWVRAADGGIEDLALLAEPLGIAEPDLPPNELAKRSIAWFETSPERWLLVLDNVAGPDELEAICPKLGEGRVLVTSRFRRLESFGPVLEIDVFDERTAAQFLVDGAHRSDDREGAHALAQALGCLPLALAHAAAYCADGASFAEYESMLDLPAAELFDSSPERSHAQTVASAWQVSIAAAADKAPFASELLLAMSYLAPDAIPVALLRELLDDGEAPGQQRRLREALNALHRYSLATVQNDEVSVHRLLQKVIRDDAAQRRDASGAKAAAQAVERLFRDDTLPETWPLCESLIAHIDALVTTADEVLEPARQASLLHHKTGYLIDLSDADRAVPAAIASSARFYDALGAEHRSTLTARNDLAVAYWLAGRLDDALVVAEATLRDRERLGDADDPHTLVSRSVVALILSSAGRTSEAIEIRVRLLADQERVLGWDSVASLTTRNNLAVTYLKTGQAAEAIDLLEGVIAALDPLLGPDHPDALSSRASLVGAYRDAGRSIDAIELARDVLADRRRVLGPNHPHTLHSAGVLHALERQ